MQTFCSPRQLRAAGLSALTLFALPLASGAQTVLSNNLSNTSDGTETASGDTWLTSSFGTGTSVSTLNAITLLLEDTTSGTAEVDVYSDGGLEPGSLVGTLTSPTTYSTSLADTTFTADGITLAANSTYWAVLKADSGSFDWSWTADDTGTGTGFQDQWGESDDAGVTWFTYDAAPTQMSVSASVAAAPEPSGAAALLIGGVLLAAAFLIRRRQSLTRRAQQGA